MLLWRWWWGFRINCIELDYWGTADYLEIAIEIIESVHIVPKKVSLLIRLTGVLIWATPWWKLHKLPNKSTKHSDPCKTWTSVCFFQLEAIDNEKDGRVDKFP